MNWRVEVRPYILPGRRYGTWVVFARPGNQQDAERICSGLRAAGKVAVVVQA